MTKLLLCLGGDPNGLCSGGYTPTHGGCYAGSARVLARLLDAGGDLEAMDYWRQTPV